MSTVESGESKHTLASRRSFTRSVTIAGTTLLLPATVSVVRGETDSGNVELDTSATIPADTNIDVTIFEDTDGDGTADRQQTETISDGQETTVYDALSSFVGQGHVLWMDIQLSTNDDTTTPELDSATITLPEEEPEPPREEPSEPMSLPEMLDDPYVFITMITLAGGVFGLASRSMAIGAWGAYLIFAYFAITSGFALLENILYVTLVLIFVGFGFKIWRLEGDGKS